MQSSKPQQLPSDQRFEPTGDLEQLILPDASEARRIPNKNRSPNQIEVSDAVWEKRLRVFGKRDLEFIEHTTFKDTRASAATLNQSMERALDIGDPIALTCTWVRCKLLRLPVADYANALGIAENTVRRLETTTHSKHDRPTADLYSAILRGWDRLGATSRDPKTIALIQQAKQELLSHLPGVNEKSSFGILTNWRYQAGLDNFEIATGCSYKAFWARNKNQQFYSFHELLTFGKKLGMLPEGASTDELQSTPAFRALEKAWIADCARLGRSRSIAKLHVLLALADVSPGQQTLHLEPEIQLPLRASMRIGKFEPVPFDRLEPVIHFLQERGVIEEQFDLKGFRNQVKNDMQRYANTFEPTLRRIAREQNIDNGMMADAFGLRGEGRQKAALPIYRALEYGEYDRTTPPGIFALLLARTEQEAAELLAQKRQELRQELTRKQSSIVSPVYIERMLWKVSYNDLPFEKAQIQELEWRSASASLDAQTALNAVLQKGLEKARDVLAFWRSVNDYSTVSAAISSMLYHGAQNSLEKQLGTSAIRLKNIAAGEETPPLPTLQRFLAAQSLPLTPRLERDWYDAFAKHQCGENQNDLDRLISSYIGAQAETLGDFHEALDLRKQACARILSGVSISGTLSADDYDTLIEKFGIGPETLFAKLLKQVQLTGSIAEGFPALLAELEATGDHTSLEGIRKLQLTLQRDTRSEKAEQRGELSVGELMARTRTIEPATTSDEEVAMKYLRALPGLTAKELVYAPREKNQLQPKPVRVLLDAALASGISERELAYCLHQTVPVARQSLQLVNRALELGVTSPLTAPGVMAQLVSKSPEELTQRLDQCREQARIDLMAVGIKARPLQIEMRIWGIRAEDISVDKRLLWEAIWTRRPQDKLLRKVQQEVDQLGAAKAAVAIDRLINSRQALFTPELSQVLMERHPSSAKGLVMEAHLPLGAGPRYAEGKEVPLFDQLIRMADITDYPFGAQQKLGWHFSMAEMLAAKIHNPVSRFLTHFALSLPKGITDPEPKVNFIMRAHRSLLQQTGLDIPGNRTILIRPDRDPLAHWKLTSEILKGLGHSESSPTYDFALCLYLYDDMGTALKNWGKTLTAYENNFPDSKPFLEACLEIASRQQSGLERDQSISLEELIAQKERLSAPDATEERFQGLLPMAHIFYGARLSDLVKAPKSSEYSRQFRTLEHAAATLKPKEVIVARGSNVSPLYHRVKAAHDQALSHRIQDRNALDALHQRIKDDEQAQQREKVILRAVDKIISESGGKALSAPGKFQVNQWCEILGDSTLAQQYQSLYLIANEALSKGKSPEEAFVRKFFELQDKRSARKNSSSFREDESN